MNRTMEKTGIDEFALFGGQPAFAELLHVGRPNIGDRVRLMERINDLLDRRWLTNNGPYLQEFEEVVARRVGVRHCVAMCNATIALEMAVRALGLQGEVIVPSFTFVATVHALQWRGITPRFCDIDPKTHMIDPVRVEELITARTTGILAVHLWGGVCDTASLEAIAHRHGLRLLFDAAHALSCSREGRMVGGFGDAEVFSFHATKFINSFEGGTVTTNDTALAEHLRRTRNFGFVGYDEVDCLGTNGKMSEVAAAMGLTSLESMDEFISTNRSNHEQYALRLKGIPGVTLLQHDATRGASNYQYIVLEIDETVAGVSRDLLHRLLQAENVWARRYFYPGCHRMEPYRSLYPDAGALLPNTERLCQRVLTLPTGTAVQLRDIELICSIIRLAVENAASIAERMKAPQSAEGPPIK